MSTPEARGAVPAENTDSRKAAHAPTMTRHAGEAPDASVLRTGAKLAAYATALAGFGANAPVVSGALLVVLTALLPLQRGSRELMKRAHVRRFTVLAFFLITYYSSTVSFGFTSVSDAMKYGSYVLSAYVLGWVSANARLPAGARSIAGVLGLVAGLSGFSALCVRGAGATLAEMDISGRAAMSIWPGGELVNGTALGIASSLAMCLLPAVFLGHPDGLSKRGFAVRVSIAALLGGIGLYANIALQNRSPFLALGAAAAAATIISARSHTRRSLAVRVVAMGALGASGYVAEWANRVEDFGVYQRFMMSGLDSPRYEIWARMLTGLLHDPWGGRVIPLGGMLYAHNLWLDVAFDAGVPALAILLMFHAMHVRGVITVLRGALPLFDRLIVACVLTSVVAAYLVEPVLQASMTYFAATCYVLGAVEGLARRRSNGWGSPRWAPGLA